MDYSSLAPTPKDEHIPLLSEPAQFKQKPGQPSETKGKTNPFLPYDTLEKLAQERAHFLASLPKMTSNEKSQPGQSAHTKSTENDSQDKRLKSLIAQTAHEVFLDFLPAMQEEIFKRLKKGTA